MNTYEKNVTGGEYNMKEKGRIQVIFKRSINTMWRQNARDGNLCIW